MYAIEGLAVALGCFHLREAEREMHPQTGLLAGRSEREVRALPAGSGGTLERTDGWREAGLGLPRRALTLFLPGFQRRRRSLQARDELAAFGRSFVFRFGDDG